MLKILEFYGIKIMMFWSDHLPPHFHAKYGEKKILVEREITAMMRLTEKNGGKR